jgi:hypothetical protein
MCPLNEVAYTHTSTSRHEKKGECLMMVVTISRWLLGLIFLSAALNGWAVILGLGAFLPTSPAAEAFLGNGYLLVGQGHGIGLRLAASD